ncbi:MAG: protein-L-isoaspartate(D-aspartate) O-methyltransferase [Nitrospirae bacterium]|nr:MAG: protein-L-isoaspartate(D-aspartate) O-methyltransferase [Nitrospirota bacterium]
MRCRRFWIAAVLGAQLLAPGCGDGFDGSDAGAPSSDPTRQAERERMVERQIEARGVKDTAVLRAMRQVPRHLFVPVSYAPQAYRDGPLALGHGQMISQPYIVAFMAEALRLRGDDRVLEIGTGSGYQTAVLAQLARDVFSIEIVKPLAEQAAAKLEELGYANVQVRAGDGYQGWPEHAPYDAILVSAAPDHIPQPLLDQLAVGGRMILPLGKKFSQDLMLIRRTHSGYERTPLLPVAFVPMTGEAQER